MEGFYRIYKGDTLVCEQKNSLTTIGRSIVLKSILGLIPSIAGNIVVGVSSEANPAANATTGLIDLNNMKFAIAQAPVSLTSLEATGAKDSLIFKATITDKTKYSIYEVGLYPVGINNNEVSPVGMLLYSGSSFDGWINASSTPLEQVTNTAESRIITADITNGTFRIGADAVFIKSGDTIKTTVLGKDLSVYGDADVLKMAIDTTATSGSPTITIKFAVDASNYYSKTFTLSTYGYQVVKCLKSEITKTGSPSWSAISEISLTTASGAFVVDGIRFDDEDNIDSNYGLISRAALPTVIEKNAGEPITIEYYLSLAFNKTVA